MTKKKTEVPQKGGKAPEGTTADFKLSSQSANGKYFAIPEYRDLFQRLQDEIENSLEGYKADKTGVDYTPLLNVRTQVKRALVWLGGAKPLEGTADGADTRKQSTHLTGEAKGWRAGAKPVQGITVNPNRNLREAGKGKVKNDTANAEALKIAQEREQIRQKVSAFIASLHEQTEETVKALSPFEAKSIGRAIAIDNVKDLTLEKLQEEILLCIEVAKKAKEADPTIVLTPDNNTNPNEGNGGDPTTSEGGE